MGSDVLRDLAAREARNRLGGEAASRTRSRGGKQRRLRPLRAAALALAALALAAAGEAQSQLSDRKLADRLSARSEEMTRTLERWVNRNTGTWNRPGLESFAGMLSERLERLGFEVSREPGRVLELPGTIERRTGPLLRGTRQATREDAPHFLLVGHYDTVFEEGPPVRHFRQLPDDPGRALGPGVSDMKGGLVVMFFALAELGRLGELDRAHWTVILNADEEIGSLASRPVIEAAAREAHFGFVFEASSAAGGMIRSRRGLGQFYLAVEGRAAHAGGAHPEGRSAILELSHKVLRIEALTDYARGVTLNVGTVEGGTKRNVIPAHAGAWIDLRYDAPEQGLRIREELERIAGKSSVDGTRATLWGRLHRPPKLPTEATLELLERHAGVARDLDLDLPEAVHAGGGSDGSLMGAVGLPTLDSMGARGGEAHTDREYVLLESLPERAGIAAVLLRRLMDARFTR